MGCFDTLVITVSKGNDGIRGRRRCLGTGARASWVCRSLAARLLPRLAKPPPIWCMLSMTSESSLSSARPLPWSLPWFLPRSWFIVSFPGSPFFHGELTEISSFYEFFDLVLEVSALLGRVPSFSVGVTPLPVLLLGRFITFLRPFDYPRELLHSC